MAPERILEKPVYVMSYERPVAAEKKTIIESTTWEGLSMVDLLNMFRRYLLMIGWSDDVARRVRLVDEVDEDAQIYEFDDRR
jgi:hypothetical protein